MHERRASADRPRGCNAQEALKRTNVGGLWPTSYGDLSVGKCALSGPDLTAQQSGKGAGHSALEWHLEFTYKVVPHRQRTPWSSSLRRGHNLYNRHNVAVAEIGHLLH